MLMIFVRMHEILMVQIRYSVFCALKKKFKTKSCKLWKSINLMYIIFLTYFTNDTYHFVLSNHSFTIYCNLAHLYRVL